jgi:hypothetical protein
LRRLLPLVLLPLLAAGAVGCNAPIPNGATTASLSASCRPRAGTTYVTATISIDQYDGVTYGRNGAHEIADGTISDISADDDSLIDTYNVQLAMNVASDTDPNGLPGEISLSQGQVISVHGDYVPSDSANASNDNGAAAVIHFTHAPCGWVSIDGQTY